MDRPGAYNRVVLGYRWSFGLGGRVMKKVLKIGIDELIEESGNFFWLRGKFRSQPFRFAAKALEAHMNAEKKLKFTDKKGKKNNE